MFMHLHIIYNIYLYIYLYIICTHTCALPVHRPPVWMSSTVMSKSNASKFTPAARRRSTT